MSPSAERPQILLLGEIEHPKSRRALENLKQFADVTTPRATNRDEFLKEAATGAFSRCTIALRTFPSIAVTGRIDRGLLAALPALRYLAHCGAGYDQIDVPACTAAGVQVSNVVGETDAATAETAVFLLLGAMRGFWGGMKRLREGAWVTGWPLGHDLRGKTLGIVGMGGIGRSVAQRVRAFGVKVIYYNRRQLPRAQEEGAEYVRFEELLRRADAVSINCPLNEQTRHLISKDEFAKMKDGVVIVNTARGPIVDEAALVAALESGKVRAAGLDVYEREPKVHPGLVGREDVILLPHMGTWTHETQEKMEEATVANVRSVLEGKGLISRVREQDGVDFDKVWKKLGKN